VTQPNAMELVWSAAEYRQSPIPDLLRLENQRGDVLLVFCQVRDTPDWPKHNDLGLTKGVRVH